MWTRCASWRSCRWPRRVKSCRSSCCRSSWTSTPTTSSRSSSTPFAPSAYAARSTISPTRSASCPCRIERSASSIGSCSRTSWTSGARTSFSSIRTWPTCSLSPLSVCSRNQLNEKQKESQQRKQAQVFVVLSSSFRFVPSCSPLFSLSIYLVFVYFLLMLLVVVVLDSIAQRFLEFSSFILLSRLFVC